MSVLPDDKDVVLDGLRKAIAEYETHLAKGRQRSKDAEVQQTQILLKDTLNLLKHTVEHIEKSHMVIATSHALLEEMKKQRRQADHAGDPKEPSTMGLMRPSS